MTTNHMGLEQTLSDERLELFIRQPLDNGLARGEQMELAREALAYRKASKGAGKMRRFDLDMSDCDSCGQDCGADMVEDLDGEYVLWEEVIPYLYQHAEYTAPPLQAVTVPMKDHQIRELVNDLRDIAIKYHGTQQLRERIARAVRSVMLKSATNEP